PGRDRRGTADGAAHQTVGKQDRQIYPQTTRHRSQGRRPPDAGADTAGARQAHRREPNTAEHAPTFHQERREARAKALIALHASDEGAVFVDAASYKNIGDAFSVSVIGAKTGEIRLAASVRTTVPSQAEEVAVALAIADPRTKTVLCDSRTAVRNFAKQRVCSAAARILRKAEVNGVITSAVIKWFPAHAGTEVAGSLGLTNHNETANSVARGLAGRAPVTAAADVVDRPEKDTMDAYNEVTLWYRLARRTMALPHPRLTREEAERATLAHILEDCECANADNSADVLPPLMEEAKRSEDYDVQHTAIQQILAALEKQRPDGMEAERVNPRHPSAAWLLLIMLAVGTVLVWLKYADADLPLVFLSKFGRSPGVLKGSVVWITGASSGIGESLSYELARAGAKLALSGTNSERLRAVKDKCIGTW
ncbi:hypothetical protein HPB47_001781, partial [Ixodes persulcatus]